MIHVIAMEFSAAGLPPAVKKQLEQLCKCLEGLA
jgi:hypothetical protein